MHLLDTTRYERLAPLCDGLGIHAAVGAVLSGAAGGSAYVDDPIAPRSALLRVKHRFFLAGAADNARFLADLGALFDADVYPRARAEDAIEFSLYYDGEAWQRPLQGALAHRHPMQSWREHYRLHAPRLDWRALLPEEMTLRTVDAALLAERDLERLEDLREEMCSERATVDEFLAHSLGVSVQHGGALVAWCLSEYDHGSRCEIGIETAAPYRRRGLASAAAAAVVERCLVRGTTEVGWHCWRSNVASGATARRVGFEKTADYPVLFAWFDEAANLAVNGNMRLMAGEAEQALTWFERSLATGRAPHWAYFGAARAATAAGRADLGLRYLDAAVERGFTFLGPIREAVELRPLHDSDGWRRLMARLGAGGSDAEPAS